MKTFLAVSLTAIAAIAFTGGASAKKLRKHPVQHVQQDAWSQDGRSQDRWSNGYYSDRDMSDRRYGAYGMMGSPYGNAAMDGNNGNSAQGPNSLGHVLGGNIGAGR